MDLGRENWKETIWEKEMNKNFQLAKTRLHKARRHTLLEL